TAETDQLAQRPGLERAAARRVRRGAVGDLRDVPDPRLVEMREQGRDEALPRLRLRGLAAAANAHPGLDEGAGEPRPDGSLVVRAVPLPHAALVPAGVARI